MKNNGPYILAISLVLAISATFAAAQFPMKLPKIGKPKLEQPKPDKPTTSGQPDSGKSASPKNSNSKMIYSFDRAPDKPAFMKNSVYIESSTHKEYWKMPNAKHSSWVPRIEFDTFQSRDSESGGYSVEYFLPNGTLWFSETLEPGFRAADRTVRHRSDRFITQEMRNAKSTNAIGIYGVKITDKASGTPLFQGKFKVGKFLPEGRAKDEVEFFVEHDWLLPMGYFGFHHSAFANDSPDNNTGGHSLHAGVWMKGDLKQDDLTATVFYNNKQVAATTDKSGGAANEEAKRAVEYAVYTTELHQWKLWVFDMGNLLYENGGSFNRDNYPLAFYADKNPGEYTVKIFNKGTQVRELKFTVAADGKLADPNGFRSQILLPNHKILVPAKVIGTSEKWNPAAWKTDAFYGNPLTGFAAP